MRTRNKRSDSPIFLVLNPWVIGGAFLIAILLFFLTLALLWLTRPGTSTGMQTTAIINVIPAPTFTPSPVSSTSSSAATATAGTSPSTIPGEIGIGAYVQVTGTGGDGLRLRSEPGLNSQILLLGSESEVFRVDDGPREIDDYTWWYLVSPDDETRHGWAVSSFMIIVQKP